MHGPGFKHGPPPKKKMTDHASFISYLAISMTQFLSKKWNSHLLENIFVRPFRRVLYKNLCAKIIEIESWHYQEQEVVKLRLQSKKK